MYGFPQRIIEPVNYRKRFRSYNGNTIFDPYNPLIWLDPESVLIVGNGGAIADWPNRGDSSCYVTTSNSATLVKEDSSFNNRPSAHFGPSWYSMFGLPGSPSAISAVLVVKLEEDPPVSEERTGLWEIGYEPGNGTSAYPYTSAAIFDEFGTTVRKDGIGTPYPMTSSHIYTVVSKSGYWENRHNGQLLFSTGTNTPHVRTSTPPYFGRSKNGGYAITYLYAYVAQFAILEYDLDAAALNDIGFALGDRFGISWNAV